MSGHKILDTSGLLNTSAERVVVGGTTTMHAHPHASVIHGGATIQRHANHYDAVGQARTVIQPHGNHYDIV